MRIKIFDVEHGQCALVEHANEHMLIDCGHNSSTGWRPSQMLRYRGIEHLDALIVTNEDEDHASDLANVLAAASVGQVYTNPTISGPALLSLKGQDRCGPGIYALSRLLQGLGGAAAAPWFDGVRIHCFWNDYPRHFQDENNLSLVVILEWSDFSICFPGDMEKAGWLRLLQDPAFRAAIASVQVFMASHHGRESGYFEPLFRLTGLSPQIVVISDAGIQYATQETVRTYGTHARGITLGDRARRVLTTRHDGMIEFSRDPFGWQVTTSRTW